MSEDMVDSWNKCNQFASISNLCLYFNVRNAITLPFFFLVCLFCFFVFFFFAFFCCCWAGVEPSQLLLRPLLGLLYQPYIIDGDDCGAVTEMNEWQGNLKYSVKISPSAALSTVNPQLEPRLLLWEAGD
jgi:hypothetical protein